MSSPARLVASQSHAAAHDRTPKQFLGREVQHARRDTRPPQQALADQRAREVSRGHCDPRLECRIATLRPGNSVGQGINALVLRAGAWTSNQSRRRPRGGKDCFGSCRTGQRDKLENLQCAIRSSICGSIDQACRTAAPISADCFIRFYRKPCMS